MPKGSHFKWTHNSIFSPCISNFYVESNFSLFACVRWRGRSWNVNEVCFLIYCLNWDYFCNSRYRAKYLLEQCTSAYNNFCRHSLHYLFNLPIGKKQILPWDIPEPPSIKLPAAKIMTPFLDLQPATSELNIPPKNVSYTLDLCPQRLVCALHRHPSSLITSPPSLGSGTSGTASSRCLHVLHFPSNWTPILTYTYTYIILEQQQRLFYIHEPAERRHTWR